MHYLLQKCSMMCCVEAMACVVALFTAPAVTTVTNVPVLRNATCVNVQYSRLMFEITGRYMNRDLIGS